jgi:hypothetical protein
MDSVTENIGKVVALMTAITSGQEELAYEMVLESDPIELFSSLAGVMMVFINKLSSVNGITPEECLKNLALVAYKPK